MKPELLCPAGNPEKLKSALLYGADAVYLAGNRFGMRAAADNFTVEEIYDAVKLAKPYGAKIFVTVNINPRTDEYADLEKFLCELRGSGISAVIAADLGVISAVRRILPDVEVHVSTQAGLVSAQSCEEYLKLGCTRAVLARELSFREIADIRKKLSREMALEAFIHGSMCVSFSGRCLLSNHFTGRDANHGECAQPCRWSYKIYEIEEEKRVGDRLPIMQTEGGTFIMSSRDMCMIEHIPELCESGIDSFKIEGRMKSVYYTAITANAYRMAIDAYLRDPAGYRFDPVWKRELESVSHREYCTGYYFDSPTVEPNTTTNLGYVRDKAYLARAISYDKASGRATFVQKNKLCANDKIEIITPGMPGRAFCVTDLRDADGNPIESAPHPLMRFSLAVPFEVKEGDILRSGE